MNYKPLLDTGLKRRKRNMSTHSGASSDSTQCFSTLKSNKKKERRKKTYRKARPIYLVEIDLV